MPPQRRSQPMYAAIKMVVYNKRMQKNIEKILNGTVVAEHALQVLQKDIQELKERGTTPCLRVVLVGNDPASAIYTKRKAKKCEELGMDGALITLPDTVRTEELCAEIERLNDDAGVHGILVQLPLPKHVDTERVLHMISPQKDVDGFHMVNVGKLQKMHAEAHVPCTAKGIWKLLQFYDIPTRGAHVVVVGRSEIVGRPVSVLLSSKHEHGNATVTLCHSATRDIGVHTRQADIVVAAIGKAHFITQDMVKEGAVLIDVGINRIDDASEKKGYRIVGDVDFEGVYEKVSAITPVPGGIGPMTIAMLMENTLCAARMQMGLL